MGFHTDLQKLSVILRRNLFPENLINKYISKYIQTAVKGGKTQPYSGVEPLETPKFLGLLALVTPSIFFGRILRSEALS